MTAPADPVTDAAHGGSDPDFAQTLADVAEVEQWMTNGQARLLWDAAARVRSGGHARHRARAVRWIALALRGPLGVHDRVPP